MTEKENKESSTIVYTSNMVSEIRKKDPNFLSITRLWEEAFRGQVQVDLGENGSLIIKRKNEL
jgi:hypothetical protein